MNPIPGQAEKVDVSADGKLYTFHLRPNAKFSNGDPLTAKNFEFGWKRLADPELAGQYQFIGPTSSRATPSMPSPPAPTKTATLRRSPRPKRSTWPRCATASASRPSTTTR